MNHCFWIMSNASLAAYVPFSHESPFLVNVSPDRLANSTESSRQAFFLRVLNLHEPSCHFPGFWYRRTLVRHVDTRKEGLRHNILVKQHSGIVPQRIAHQQRKSMIARALLFSPRHRSLHLSFVFSHNCFANEERFR